MENIKIFKVTFIDEYTNQLMLLSHQANDLKLGDNFATVTIPFCDCLADSNLLKVFEIPDNIPYKKLFKVLFL